MPVNFPGYNMETVKFMVYGMESGKFLVSFFSGIILELLFRGGGGGSFILIRNTGNPRLHSHAIVREDCTTSKIGHIPISLRYTV